MKKIMIFFLAFFILNVCSIASAEDVEMDASYDSNMGGMTATYGNGFATGSQDIPPLGGGYSVMLTVAADTTWTATASASWITVVTSGGTGTRRIYYNVPVNNDEVAARSGTITVRCENTSEVYVFHLYQKRRVVWPVGTYDSATGIHTATEPPDDKLDKELRPNKGSVVTGVGDITSFYGARVTSENSKHKRHWAIDIDVGESTDIKAMAVMSGEVSKVGFDSEKGNYVEIKHKVGNAEFITRYLHLKSYSVSKGDRVNATTKIGIVGGTGSAKGDLHLHFDIRKNVKQVFYSFDSVPYYHGSDDRGVTTSAYNASGLKLWSNNPLYVVGSDGKWKPNLNCNLYYSLISVNGDFYELYMNAHRYENVIEIAN